MRQLLLEVLSCSWERLSGKHMFDTGQLLGVGPGLEGQTGGSSQPLPSSTFLETEIISWCLRHYGCSLISPNRVWRVPLRRTFFMFSLIEIPGYPFFPRAKQLPLQFESSCAEYAEPTQSTKFTVHPCTCSQISNPWAVTLCSLISNAHLNLNTEREAICIVASTHCICTVFQVESI